MEYLDQTFFDYIEEYKKLDINSKREELINSLKEMIAIIDMKAKSEEINLYYLKSKEILDLNSNNVSEDDFLEAALVYLETGKHLIGEYLDKKNNDIKLRKK